MKYIRRDSYVDRIKPYIGKPIIKVLTGQRRVGKSCIMLQLCDEVKALDANATTIYINCELEKLRAIRNSSDLYR